MFIYIYINIQSQSILCSEILLFFLFSFFQRFVSIFSYICNTQKIKTYFCKSQYVPMMYKIFTQTVPFLKIVPLCIQRKLAPKHVRGWKTLFLNSQPLYEKPVRLLFLVYNYFPT